MDLAFQNSRIGLRDRGNFYFFVGGGSHLFFFFCRHIRLTYARRHAHTHSNISHSYMRQAQYIEQSNRYFQFFPYPSLSAIPFSLLTTIRYRSGGGWGEGQAQEQAVPPQGLARADQTHFSTAGQKEKAQSLINPLPDHVWMQLHIALLQCTVL